MKKVMLVIDEIQQLHGLESFLRRLGFDVLSLGKDSLVSDAILSFVPEVVIASERGRNVDGLRLAQKLKKTIVPLPRMALCFNGAAPIISAQDLKAIDALLELPLAGEAGLRLLAQLAGVSAEPLVEKYRKFAGAKLTREEEIVIITGAVGGGSGPTGGAETGREAWDPKRDVGQAAEIRTARSSRYDKFLDANARDFEGGVTERVLPRERAQAAMKELKKQSASEAEELARIHAEKIKFAEAMFEEGTEKNPTKKK